MKAAEAPVEMREAALVLADALEEERPIDGAPAISLLAYEVFRAAIGQWLLDTSRKPQLRPGRVNSRSWMVRHGFAFVKSDRGERAVVCLFCRKSINTLGRRDRERRIPAAFIESITNHTVPCGIQWLARQIATIDRVAHLVAKESSSAGHG